MTYYKTGEFAKLASVSVRTIRYYDEIGLLKPTLIEENGYRMYSDKDYLKLQKIISLKSLGFSLDDIFAMTVDDDYISLTDTFILQQRMIDSKIHDLQLQKESIESTLQMLKKNQQVDWVDILHDIHFKSMESELVEQYKNANNVEIRIKLHEKYSTNPIKWFDWLFQLYKIQPGEKVLEVGCGNGELWVKNPKCHGEITLSDISPGMLEDAKKRLSQDFQYVCADVQSLPFEDQSFDKVIANHVLFYVKDLNLALKEIQRVLKPGGKLYASAYGPTHMKEITELVKEFDPRINLSNIALYDQFGLHNGKELLSNVFDQIDVIHYEDSLFVDDTNDLVYYMLSCHGNQSVYLSQDFDRFSKYISKKTKNGVHITKNAGVFVCVK